MQVNNTIKAGFDAQDNKFEVEMDAFPQGMVELKRQHRREFMEQVSQRVQDLEETFRDQENQIEKLVDEEQVDATNELLRTARITTKSKIISDQHLPLN